MTKPIYDVILVIPVGPGSVIDFVADTVESFGFYTRRTYHIIFADDSQQGIGAELKARFPRADVIVTGKAMGGWAGLYITLSLAFRYAVEKYDFKAILKLDTDALIIGEEPEEDALRLFGDKPQAGVAGQYPNDYVGAPWNLNWPRQRIVNGTRTWKFFRRPVANWLLMKQHNKALKNGYRTGESVFGGAYFMGAAYLRALYGAGLLPNYMFQSLNLGEDHLFSLLAPANGFTLESLSGKGQPFGCAWKGLPVSPEELLKDGKKIVHSVRSWEGMDEAAVRHFFREKRMAAVDETNSML